MTELRHACAAVARLAERIGDETTPATHLPALLLELRAAVARVEIIVGVVTGPLPIGSLIGSPIGGITDATWRNQFGGDR